MQLQVVSCRLDFSGLVLFVCYECVYESNVIYIERSHVRVVGYH